MNGQYLRAVKHVWRQGRIAQPRDLRVREVFNYMFHLDYPGINQSTLKPWHTRIHYAEAEYEWYKSGSNKIKDLPKKFQHLWKPFSDDGLTVNSAYGHYIHGKINPYSYLVGPREAVQTQWDWCKAKLRADPDTRHAIININQSEHKFEPTKDFPCCVCMHFTLRDNRLNLFTLFRSQDINTGLRNDVYTMTRLQADMARELGVGVGVYDNLSLNLHMYEPDWPAARKVLKRGLYYVKDQGHVFKVVSTNTPTDQKRLPQ